MQTGVRSSTHSCCRSRHQGCTAAPGMPGSPRITLHSAPASAEGVPLLMRGLVGLLFPLHPAPASCQTHAGSGLTLPCSSTSTQLQSHGHLGHVPEKSLHPTSWGVTSKLGMRVPGWRWLCLTSASILSEADSCQGMTDRFCFFSVFCILFHIQLSGRGIRRSQQCCIWERCWLLQSKWFRVFLQSA